MKSSADLRITVGDANRVIAWSREQTYMVESGGGGKIDGFQGTFDFDEDRPEKKPL